MFLPAIGRLLTVREVAERLGLKSSSIRVWKLRRKIGYVRLGRAIRIPESEIERLMVEGFVPAREVQR